MTAEVYEDRGVHFEYPSSWSLDVTDEGPVTTVDLQHPGGIAFVLVRTDDERPDPADLADQALEAMREEYPDLDAYPAMETLHDHRAIGHDVEFFSLDIANAAAHSLFPHRAAPFSCSASGQISVRTTWARS